MKKGSMDSLKVFFIVVGAVATFAALVLAAYTIFKKYFEITFECDGDCDSCNECFSDDEEENCEPICCCEDEEEAPAEDAE